MGPMIGRELLKMRTLVSFGVALTACAVADPTCAQTSLEQAPQVEKRGDIVVTAPRIKGSVETDLPLELVLDENAIASYGASNIADLLGALGNQTQSTRSRGQGGGFPIVLLNGRRVSGFQEMRDLPSEAIKRVEILPEDVAIRFGFAPGQRVVNFILKEGWPNQRRSSK
jgi:iron complex outermembrane recepter protein